MLVRAVSKGAVPSKSRRGADGGAGGPGRNDTSSTACRVRSNAIVRSRSPTTRPRCTCIACRRNRHERHQHGRPHNMSSGSASKRSATRGSSTTARASRQRPPRPRMPPGRGLRIMRYRAICRRRSSTSRLPGRTGRCHLLGGAGPGLWVVSSCGTRPRRRIARNRHAKETERLAVVFADRDFTRSSILRAAGDDLGDQRLAYPCRRRVRHDVRSVMPPVLSPRVAACRSISQNVRLRRAEVLRSWNKHKRQQPNACRVIHHPRCIASGWFHDSDRHVRLTPASWDRTIFFLRGKSRRSEEIALTGR